MDEFFGMSKDEAPENIPMMLLTFPSAKDPTSQIRHPGNILTDDQLVDSDDFF